MKRSLALLLVSLILALLISGCTVNTQEKVFDQRSFFEFACANRLDYVPEFAEEYRPSTADTYLMYAFVLDEARIKKRGNDEQANCWMEQEYVENVARIYFGVDPITHKSLPKTWNYDPQMSRYTAVPSSYNFPGSYVMRSCKTEQRERGMVYVIEASVLDIGGGVSALIPLTEPISTGTEHRDERYDEFISLIMQEGIYRESMTYYEALCEIFERGLADRLKCSPDTETFVFTMKDDTPQFLSHTVNTNE